MRRRGKRRAGYVVRVYPSGAVLMSDGRRYLTVEQAVAAGVVLANILSAVERIYGSWKKFQRSRGK